MSKFEKRVCIFTAVFVSIYVFALCVSIHSRIAPAVKESRLERVGPSVKEKGVVLAELLLPMLIVAVVTVSFILVRRKQAQRRWALEDEEPVESQETLAEATPPLPVETKSTESESTTPPFASSGRGL